MWTGISITSLDGWTATLPAMTGQSVHWWFLEYELWQTLFLFLFSFFGLLMLFLSQRESREQNQSHCLSCTKSRLEGDLHVQKES